MWRWLARAPAICRRSSCRSCATWILQAGVAATIPAIVARRRIVLSQPARHRARRHAVAGRRGGDRVAQQLAQADIHSSPLTAMLAPPKAFGRDGRDGRRQRLTYWSFRCPRWIWMNITIRRRAGLARVIERWIAHLLGVAVEVETVASIEDRDWRWFIGLDSEGTKIGNALWNGAELESNAAERIISADAPDHRGIRGWWICAPAPGRSISFWPAAPVVR